MHAILDPPTLIRTFGVIGVFLIVFAETGLMAGFFLPGDSLLVVAGVAASPAATRAFHGRLSFTVLLIGTPLFAILGAQTGHLIGSVLGERLLRRPDSRWFRRSRVEAARRYFVRLRPGRAVLLARFIPVVRTFINPVAGVLEMPSMRFLWWNVIGGVLWTDGLLVLAYLLGDSLADKLGIVSVVVIAVALSPLFAEAARARLRRRRSRRGVSTRVDDAKDYAVVTEHDGD